MQGYCGRILVAEEGNAEVDERRAWGSPACQRTFVRILFSADAEARRKIIAANLILLALPHLNHQVLPKQLPPIPGGVQAIPRGFDRTQSPWGPSGSTVEC